MTRVERERLLLLAAHFRGPFTKAGNAWSIMYQVGFASFTDWATTYRHEFNGMVGDDEWYEDLANCFESLAFDGAAVRS